MQIWYDILNYSIVLAVGFIVGFINTLAGSGSLLTLPLLMWLGLDPLTANGTNRIAILMQGAAGVVMFHRQGQYQYRHDLRYILPAVFGSIPGAFIAVDLDEAAMHKVIAIVMLLILAVMIANPARYLKKHPVETPGRALVMMILFFFIGMYGGFIQAGVGILMLAAFSLSGEMTLLRANAVKVLITMIFTIAVLPVFIAHKQVDYFYGVLMGIGSMGGAWWSARMAFRKGTPFLKFVLYTVILATAIYMLIKNGS
ncbi:MAG TPA: sulfite exporter TauE/SafE family protein [Bacteroidales bacterium]|nr:sulfite exporter TauE/SafE family protein [Bacteroidales bacterium]HRZ48043.1 sulfite exporter TauE/SafE family protein [Bacteroidales bacterium]